MPRTSTATEGPQATGTPAGMPGTPSAAAGTRSREVPARGYEVGTEIRNAGTEGREARTKGRQARSEGRPGGSGTAADRTPEAQLAAARAGAGARVPVVTIDGPSGSGKGTISRAVAERVGWHLLDSGALYRLVALAGMKAGLAPDDAEGHALLAAEMDVGFGVGPGGSELVTLGDEDVTAEIRSEAAGQGASRVAAWPPVRTALLERQRAFAQPPGLVADGRDMGTVVFPTADLKIFLTASPEERALRRYKQLKDKGSGVSLSALSREITERDLRDSTRAVAPLKPAPDAEAIDSTGLSIEEVVGRVLELGRRRSLWT